jgi:hypothetical protein
MAGREAEMMAMNMICLSTLKILPAVLLALATVGCTTWGSKTPMGPTRYAPTNFQQVRILWNDPSEPYEEIGLVSVLGGAAFITQETDMPRKLQKSAADLGADAVIIVREGATRNVTAGGGGSSSGWGFGASSFEYPRNLGRAIKYRNPALQIPPRTRR